MNYQFELLSIHADSGKYLWINLTTLSWYAWPAWPLAAYAIWFHRKKITSPALLGPLVLAISTLITLSLASESRQVWLATVLPPLALLSVPALMVLRRGAESLLDWFGRTVFGLLLLVVALGWSALVFGWPSRWATKAERLAPGFVANIDPLALAFSLLIIGGWIWIILSSRRSPHKSLFSWSGGLIAFWATIVALWLPWVDYQRSYRSVALEIKKSLSNASECVRAYGMSEAQYAAMDYYLTNPIRRKTANGPSCRLLLTTGKGLPEGRWQAVWEGTRPGDKSERYQLYRQE